VSGNLEGGTAFVTGAASGIGAAVAERLAAQGDAVALFDLSEAGLAATSATIEAAGGRALSLPGDVTDGESVAAAVQRAVTELGPLRTVAACAGVGVAGGLLGPVTELSQADWDRTIAVNLTGVYITARHTIPELLESGGGAFVAIASDAGVTGTQGMGAYCASKHGVVGLIRSLALDHGAEGIRSNVVCPAMVETPMADAFFAEISAAERQAWERTVPIGRFARPAEVAEVIAHLTSPQASYTNGHVYLVDGGATAGYFEPAA
jgi:meso-butanediol dehydrogenase / (S,S)-butanediol dehydrogenase / diacetyl reductase